jgi:hypothetical protein
MFKSNEYSANRQEFSLTLWDRKLSYAETSEFMTQVQKWLHVETLMNEILREKMSNIRNNIKKFLNVETCF